MARGGLLTRGWIMRGAEALRRGGFGTYGLGRWVRTRRLSAITTLALLCLGPVFAFATAVVLSRASAGLMSPGIVRLTLLADLVYVLALVGVIAITIARIYAQRRRRASGSRLHLRLAGLFTLVALAPTVLVAVFATLTVNFGLEAWFSNSVGSVVRNALSVAEAYAVEHRENIRGEALAMANDLNRSASVGMNADALGELTRQQQILRSLPEAYVLDGEGDILARGEFSYLFTLEQPTPRDFARAREGEVVLIEDEENNEIRALVHLTGLLDSYLYVTRRIEGDVLMLLDETRETVSLYERLERERAGMLVDFALLYLGFAALVILAAMVLGLRFAERLAKPIGRLAGAAERVGEGDLLARVKEPKGADEIAALSRGFNRMTRQLKRQRDALMAANEAAERRRRFIETVLSGVSAGVVGLDARARVELANAAAAEMLGLDAATAPGRLLLDAAPALGPLVARALASPERTAQDQLRLVVGGREREILARATPKGENAEEGWVLTLDDLTELVAAQRMAAWGDVARRIAHEIKNPLTPIQLSADRLRRKFGKLPEAERGALQQYADVISRQAQDIRRMVDAFSQFAKMPEPERRADDVGATLRDAVLLRRSAGDGIAWKLDAPETGPRALCDRGLIGQALGNLLKNAAEAIEARRAAGGEAGAEAAPPGEVRASVRERDGRVVIEIADNGVGLPVADRGRLTEPYVTTRAKGTGLGLAIVQKIVEQHGGQLLLTDAPPFAPGDRPGALVRVTLPGLAGTPSLKERNAA